MDISILDECMSFNYLYSEQYNKFCRDLDTLRDLLDEEIYIEKVDDKSESKVKRFIKGSEKTVNRTVNTTKDLAGAHSNITRAGGDIIYSGWSVVVKLLKIVTKSISFIASKISAIPDFILKVINNIEKIPENVRNMIRGNIQLYICAEDINLLYNKNLLKYTLQFISSAKYLADGEMWSTFFSRKDYSKNKEIYKLTPTDEKLCKNMKSNYVKINKMKFEKTTIDMNNKNEVEVYFGGTKSIKFYDFRGQLHETTYHEALIQLVKDIQGEIKSIEHIREIIGDKIDKSIVSEELGRLSPKAQDKIIESITMVSNVIGTLSNIVRYIMEDIKTISNSANKILEVKKIKVNNKSVREANKENKEARKNKKG